MSLTLIRPYFDSKLKELDLVEHKDAFNNENIANTKLDKSYHFRINDVSSSSISNNGQELTASITVEIVVKGFRNNQEGYDKAVKLGQSAILSIMSLDRLNVAGLKNILFQSMEFNPLNISNDNVIRVTQNYDVNVYLCY